MIPPERRDSVTVIGSVVWVGENVESCEDLDVLKIILTIAFLISGPASVHAAEDAVDCKFDEKYAEVIMTHRQVGKMDLSTMMEVLKTKPELRNMILDAYDHPLVRTPQARNLAIRHFSSIWALRCL